MAACAVVYGLLALAGHGCPIKLFTGIPCPGCGMSRAYLSLLKLDVRGALGYHPLFWLVIPGAYALYRYETGRRERPVALFLIGAGICFIAVYVVRLAMGTPPVDMDIREGLLYRAASFCLQMLRAVW